MKLLIEPPTWLGDSVMASGAIKELIDKIDANEKIIFGSFVAVELLKGWFDKEIIFNKNQKIKEFLEFPQVDLFISFRRSLYSKLLGFKAKRAIFFDNSYLGHMVYKYSNYVNSILNQNRIYSPILDFKPKLFSKPTLGLNPGAAYGSAKRWYPKEFAKVANELSHKYDIIIFGGSLEKEIAKDIESELKIDNYLNLCGKLSIKELCEYIGGIDLFITNDSGPMHIAAAYNTPTVAIFGPTDFTETSPYSKSYKIVTKNLDCAPCKRRECPLKGANYHRCMKDIEAKDVLEAIRELI